jgi:uncharacterized membrane protein (UPF0127 family)
MGFHKTVVGFAALALVGGIVAAALFSEKRTARESVEPQIVLDNGSTLSLILATTTIAREQGLGGRVLLAPNTAMLFVFPSDGMYGFWMKDMQFPIDILWLDASAKVVHIESSLATSTYPKAFYPSSPVRFVLETDAGFAEYHHIKIGTPLELKNVPTVAE